MTVTVTVCEPGAMERSPATDATAASVLVIATGVSTTAGFRRIGTVTVACPLGDVNTRPSSRAGTTTTPTGAALLLMVLATGALTDAMAHVSPRDELAAIVVAPVDTPVT